MERPDQFYIDRCPSPARYYRLRLEAALRPEVDFARAAELVPEERK